MAGKALRNTVIPCKLLSILKEFEIIKKNLFLD
jgi:hypothetical protein